MAKKRLGTPVRPQATVRGEPLEGLFPILGRKVLEERVSIQAAGKLSPLSRLKNLPQGFQGGIDNARVSRREAFDQ